MYIIVSTGGGGGGGGGGGEAADLENNSINLAILPLFADMSDRTLNTQAEKENRDFRR